MPIVLTLIFSMTVLDRYQRNDPCSVYQRTETRGRNKNLLVLRDIVKDIGLGGENHHFFFHGMYS